MSFLDVTPEEWHRIRGAADTLLDMPPEDRESASREEFPGEENLRLAALELARRFDDSPDFLGVQPFPKIGQPAPETVLSTGDCVGAYRIESEIGRGGMGRVYRATRADGAFDKTVAIKLIRVPGIAAIERFRAERRILAGLEHENIARLYDAGAAADGAQYFVMEYVEGLSLDIYCRGRDRRSILQLFRIVAGAVAYAHRGGVIHRDLKPGNVLVTPAGTPKLLDFGIATLKANPGTASAAGITPAFASPEQLTGDPATERSDVYSLGLMLRVVLGRDRTDRELAEASHSSALPPGLPRELAAVLGKALAQDPSDRYPSATEFAGDLDRYLNSYPVHALPSRWTWRLSCLVRRNKLAAGLAAAFLLASAAGVGGVILQQRGNQRQLQAADQIARKILADETQFRGLAGATEIRRRMLAEALDHLRSVAPEGASDPDLTGDFADAYLRIGLVLGMPGAPSLGDFAGAEASIRRGRVIAEGIVRRWPQSRRGHELLATGLAYEEALVGRRGDDAQCIRLGERAHAEFLGVDASTPDLTSALIQNEGMMARCYTKLGELDKAISGIRRWIAREKQAPSSGASAESLLAAYARLARTLYEAGDLDGGRAAFEETIRLRREAYSRQPDHNSGILLAQELISAASARLHPCREPADLPDIRESVKLASLVYGEDQKNATVFSLFADAQRCLAMNLGVANGHAPQALSLLAQNRSLLMTADPAASSTRTRLAQNWLQSSVVSQAMSDWKTAERDVDEALAALHKGQPEPADWLLTADCWSKLGDIRLGEGRAADAVAIFRKQLEAARQYARVIPGRNTTLDLARALHEVGLRISSVAPAEAVADLSEAVDIFHGVPFPPPAETARAQSDWLNAR